MNLGLSRADKSISEGFLIDSHSQSPLWGGVVPPVLVAYFWSPTKMSRSRTTCLDSPGSHSCVWCSAEDGDCSCPVELFPPRHKQMMGSCFLLHPPSHPTKSLYIPFLSRRKAHFAVQEGSPKPSLAMNCVTCRTGSLQEALQVTDTSLAPFWCVQECIIAIQSYLSLEL